MIVSVVFFFIYKTIEVLARRRERLMMVEAFARNPELCRERGGSFRMEILRDVYGVLLAVRVHCRAGNRLSGVLADNARKMRMRMGNMPKWSSLHSCVFAADSACWGHSLRNGGCVAATGCRQELEMHDRGPERSFP